VDGANIVMSELKRAFMHLERVQRICPKHGEYGAVVVRGQMADFISESVCPGCSKDDDAARLAKENAEFVAKQIDLSNIPPKDRRPLSSFPAVGAHVVAVMQRWITVCAEMNRQEKKGAWIVLQGPTGTGKSGLAFATASEFLKGGRTVRCYTISELKAHCWSAESRGSNRLAAMKEVSSCDLLVIDDVGSTKMVDSEIELVYEVVDDRYKKCKPIIFTTNMTKTQLEALGDRTFSRINHRATFISCKWKSLRDD